MKEDETPDVDDDESSVVMRPPDSRRRVVTIVRRRVRCKWCRCSAIAVKTGKATQKPDFRTRHGPHFRHRGRRELVTMAARRARGWAEARRRGGQVKVERSEKYVVGGVIVASSSILVAIVRFLIPDRRWCRATVCLPSPSKALAAAEILAASSGERRATAGRNKRTA